MKYALIDGIRREAEPRLSGKCLACVSTMVAKCGEVRVWHWAHYRKPDCDHWWESETEWHRHWKNQFPADWQEVVLRAETGEKHIADVKTEHGLVIEFQHSPLKPEERRSREAFYGQMVWVVDALRKERDLKWFCEALARSPIIVENPLIYRISTYKCALLEGWIDAKMPVLFDAGESPPYGSRFPFDQPVLWQLYANSSDSWAYMLAVSKAKFKQAMLTGARILDIDFSNEITSGLEVLQMNTHAALELRPIIVSQMES